MKEEKSNKIKVKTALTVYYKDEENKTIEEIVLKLTQKDLESRVSNEASKSNNSAIL